MAQAIFISLVTISFLSCPQNQDSKEAAFWRWFQTMSQDCLISKKVRKGSLSMRYTEFTLST